MATITRPWPAPPEGESDFILRDPAAVAHLISSATVPGPGTCAARAVISDHNAAVDAMLQMQEVWLRYLDGAQS